jgi:hypothetical protein
MYCRTNYDYAKSKGVTILSNPNKRLEIAQTFCKGLVKGLGLPQALKSKTSNFSAARIAFASGWKTNAAGL